MSCAEDAALFLLGVLRKNWWMLLAKVVMFLTGIVLSCTCGVLGFRIFFLSNPTLFYIFFTRQKMAKYWNLKRKTEKNVRVLKRLYFIRYLYKGMSVEEAAQLVGVTKATGYSWLKRWNDKGYEGLIPNFGGGRPPKITREQKEELREMLAEKDAWTTREVQELVRKKFGVTYSSWQVRRILRSLGMN